MCLGVVARGGGKRGVLRIFNVSSTSGAEPVEDGWLVLLCLPNKVTILSTSSILTFLQLHRIGARRALRDLLRRHWRREDARHGLHAMLIAHTRVYEDDSSFATATSVSFFLYAFLRIRLTGQPCPHRNTGFLSCLAVQAYSALGSS